MSNGGSPVVGVSSAAPSFARVALRPRWIAVLILALLVASAFAALGRWQLERSVIADAANQIDTETPVELLTVAEPATPVDSASFARIVDVTGSFVADDFLVLHGRLQEGEGGAWLIGRLLVTVPEDAGASIRTEPEPVSLAVALGWAESAEAALAAIPDWSEEREYRGRYLPGEAPRPTDLETGERSALSIAELVNVWPDYEGSIFAGYLILAEQPAGLEPIAAPPPLPEQQVNLLNLFYAVEWALFGGFAVYLWWRLVKDEMEKEAQQRTAEAAPGAAVD